MKLQLKIQAGHILVLMSVILVSTSAATRAFGQYPYGGQPYYGGGQIIEERIISDVPLTEPAAGVPIGGDPTMATPVPGYTAPPPATTGMQAAYTSPPGQPGGYAYPATGQVYQAEAPLQGVTPGQRKPALPVTEGYDYTNYLQRPPLSPSPDYPRHGYPNPMTTQATVSEELPAMKGHPTTVEETLPERVGQMPPLKPYPEQESYSYFTDTVTSASPVCQKCGEGYGNPAIWKISAGVKVAHRSSGDMEKYLVFDSYGNPFATQQSYTVTPGLEMTLTRYLGRNASNFDIWMDVRFDGLFHWNNSSIYVDNVFYVNGLLGMVPGIGPAVGPEYKDSDNKTGNLYYPNIYKMDYDSSYNSGELLFRFRKRGRPDPLVGHPNGRWTRECQHGLRYTHTFGLRYSDLREELDWTGTVYESSIYDDPLAVGHANAKLENHMLGLVLGGELEDKRCTWSWGMKWRIVSSVNMTKSSLLASSTQAFNLGNGEMYSYESISHKNDISYQLEGGVFATYKMWPHCTLRIGYDFSFLDRLALVENNMEMDIYGKSRINNRNSIFMQMLTIGATWSW